MSLTQHRTSIPFRLAKWVFVLLIIGTMLFKPFSSYVLDLSEESIELSLEITEKDSDEKNTSEISSDFSFLIGELTGSELGRLKGHTYSYCSFDGDFRPDIELPPPRV